MILLLMLLRLLAQVPFPSEFGDNFTMASIVVAFLMPVVIDFLNGQSLDSRLKAVLAFIWCALAAIILTYAMHTFDNYTLSFQQGFRAFLIIFVGAIALHHVYWKPSGISDRVAALRG